MIDTEALKVTLDLPVLGAVGFVFVILRQALKRLETSIKALPCHPKLDGTVDSEALKTAGCIMEKLFQPSPKKT